MTTGPCSSHAHMGAVAQPAARKRAAAAHESRGGSGFLIGHDQTLKPAVGGGTDRYMVARGAGESSRWIDAPPGRPSDPGQRMGAQDTIYMTFLFQYHYQAQAREASANGELS